MMILKDLARDRQAMRPSSLSIRMVEGLQKAAEGKEVLVAEARLEPTRTFPPQSNSLG